MYSQFLQKQAIEEANQKEKLGAEDGVRAQKLERELYEMKNFEYTPKPILS